MIGASLPQFPPPGMIPMGIPAAPFAMPPNIAPQGFPPQASMGMPGGPVELMAQPSIGAPMQFAAQPPMMVPAPMDDRFNVAVRGRDFSVEVGGPMMSASGSLVAPVMPHGAFLNSATDDPMTSRIASVLHECKNRLVGRRTEMSGLKSQRDFLARSLREAEVDFLRLGSDWRRLEQELEDARSLLTPEHSHLGTPRSRHRSVPRSAERDLEGYYSHGMSSASRRGRDRTMRSPPSDTPGSHQRVSSAPSPISPPRRSGMGTFDPYTSWRRTQEAVNAHARGSMRDPLQPQELLEARRESAMQQGLHRVPDLRLNEALRTAEEGLDLDGISTSDDNAALGGHRRSMAPPGSIEEQMAEAEMNLEMSAQLAPSGDHAGGMSPRQLDELQRRRSHGHHMTPNGALMALEYPQYEKGEHQRKSNFEGRKSNFESRQHARAPNLPSASETASMLALQDALEEQELARRVSNVQDAMHRDEARRQSRRHSRRVNDAADPYRDENLIVEELEALKRMVQDTNSLDDCSDEAVQQFGSVPVEVSVHEERRSRSPPSPLQGDCQARFRTIAAWELSDSKEATAGSTSATLLGGAFNQGAFKPGRDGGVQVAKPPDVGPVTLTFWEARLGEVQGDYCVLAVGLPGEGTLFSYRPQPPPQAPASSRSGFRLGDLPAGEFLAPHGTVFAMSASDAVELGHGNASLARAGWNHHAFVFGASRTTWFINGHRAVEIKRNLLGLGLGILTIGNSADGTRGDQANTVLIKRVALYEGELGAEEICGESVRGPDDFEWVARQKLFAEERRLFLVGRGGSAMSSPIQQEQNRVEQIPAVGAPYLSAFQAMNPPLTTTQTFLAAPTTVPMSMSTPAVGSWSPLKPVLVPSPLPPASPKAQLQVPVDRPVGIPTLGGTLAPMPTSVPIGSSTLIGTSTLLPVPLSPPGTVRAPIPMVMGTQPAVSYPVGTQPAVSYPVVSSPPVPLAPPQGQAIGGTVLARPPNVLAPPGSPGMQPLSPLPNMPMTLSPPAKLHFGSPPAPPPFTANPPTASTLVMPPGTYAAPPGSIAVPPGSPSVPPVYSAPPPSMAVMPPGSFAPGSVAVPPGSPIVPPPTYTAPPPSIAVMPPGSYAPPISVVPPGSPMVRPPAYTTPPPSIAVMPPGSYAAPPMPVAVSPGSIGVPPGSPPPKIVPPPAYTAPPHSIAVVPPPAYTSPSVAVSPPLMFPRPGSPSVAMRPQAAPPSIAVTPPGSLAVPPGSPRLPPGSPRPPGVVVAPPAYTAPPVAVTPQGPGTKIVRPGSYVGSPPSMAVPPGSPGPTPALVGTQRMSPPAPLMGATILPTPAPPIGVTTVVPPSVGTFVAPAMTFPAPVSFAGPQVMQQPRASPLGASQINLDQALHDLLSREGLPRDLVRLGSGDYLYGGERLEVFLSEKAGRTPQVKVRTPFYSGGQAVDLHQFAKEYEKDFIRPRSPSPSPERPSTRITALSSPPKMIKAGEDIRPQPPRMAPVELMQGTQAMRLMPLPAAPLALPAPALVPSTQRRSVSAGRKSVVGAPVQMQSPRRSVSVGRRASLVTPVAAPPLAVPVMPGTSRLPPTATPPVTVTSPVIGTRPLSPAAAQESRRKSTRIRKPSGL